MNDRPAVLATTVRLLHFGSSLCALFVLYLRAEEGHNAELLKTLSPDNLRKKLQKIFRHSQAKHRRSDRPPSLPVVSCVPQGVAAPRFDFAILPLTKTPGR